jgi:hypothetical protein
MSYGKVFVDAREVTCEEGDVSSSAVFWRDCSPSAF